MAAIGFMHGMAITSLYYLTGLLNGYSCQDALVFAQNKSNDILTQLIRGGGVGDMAGFSLIGNFATGIGVGDAVDMLFQAFDTWNIPGFFYGEFKAISGKDFDPSRGGFSEGMNFALAYLKPTCQ